MHTPDGFLTSWICVVMLLAVVVPLLLAINNIRKTMTKEKALQYASLAVIIFAAQMLNFPIANGTSGHLLGAALVAILLGTDAAVLILSSVLVVQAFIFGDGGLLALGANIFNMAVIGSYVAHFVYSKYKNAFFASWGSVVTASLSCALLLGISGTVQLIPAIFAMASIHVIIGIGEALITILLINYFWNRALSVSSSYNIALVSTAFSFLLLALLLPFASSDPDGLEKVALNLGFFENAVTIYTAPLADYTLLTGIIGMVAVFALTYLILNLKIPYPSPV